MVSRIRCTVRSSLLVLLSLTGFHQPANTQSDTVWADLYRRDLTAVRALLSSNHPGAVDAENPAFARTIESGYQEALSAAPSVTSYSAYRLALTRYVNRFQDAHLGLGFDRPFTEVGDPGIYPVFRNGAFVVREIDARYGSGAKTLRGAILLDCDGRSPDDMFRNGILSWRGRPAIQADWYLLAPYLLVDFGRPTPSGPSSCRFSTGQQTQTLPLVWSRVPGSAVRERVEELTSFESRSLALERLEDGDVVWVHVPTFGVYDSASIAAMHDLIATLEDEMRRNRSWRLLVFDLRGNSGGSSAWGNQIAAAVFGEEWIDLANEWLFDGVYTEWRVSSDNVQALRGIVRQQEQRHGVDSENARYYRAFTDSMVVALERGDPYLGTPEARSGVSRPEPVSLPGDIVLITSASCYSACLGFLDRMFMHPAVTHVGQPTGVDTDYMENWSRPLPTGLARLGYPMKVYRNRRRAANQSYTPSVLLEDLHDTATVRSVVLSQR